MASSTTSTPTGKITRDDLEQKFRGLQDGVKGSVEDRKSAIVTIGAAAAVVILLLAYVLGRKSGKRKTTLVEIRRV